MSTNAQLKALIARLFNCDASQLTDDIGPGGIPGWDSLGHVTLMAAIQQEFGKQVPLEDAIEVESIADLTVILDRIEPSQPVTVDPRALNAVPHVGTIPLSGRAARDARVGPSSVPDRRARLHQHDGDCDGRIPDPLLAAIPLQGTDSGSFFHWAEPASCSALCPW